MNDLPNRDVVIFTEAAQLPAAERAAYLAGACGGDAELRQKVEALLRTHDHVGDFLEASPRNASMGARVDSSTGEKAGDRIGRYKLLQQIGEGGWGVVYMAEQEEPVRRKVALKVVKPGMDTNNVIARFEAERQALALMDHPNIAHVLDAGATENGRPYFVMELVRGIKITDYCDQHSLTTEDRLELFTQVCNAVQHAHQKGIIHRDIKPSNVLVTTSSEGKPLPKVIDFGIAKATTGLQLTDKTLFTAFEMLIGTPAYMSPEQAALTSVDVDTRTDIYSLGVLLYELLTSTTPFDTKELLKAGLDEVRRVIQTEEPVRPSTRLRTMMPANRTSISQQRQADAPKLIHDMSGDLDWIVMKALEKDRERRYQTANALAEDIQRYIENETVSARPPSVAYKCQKLIARHTLGFLAFGIALSTMLAGLGITVWSLENEKRAHREALTEATRSGQVARFLNDMLTSGDPLLANGRGPAEAMLRDMLDKAAKRVGTELTNQPAVQAELRLTIGRVYGNLGLIERAETMIQDALMLYRELPDSEEKVSNARSDLSTIYSWEGKIAQSQEEARKALAIMVKLKGEENMDVVRLETKLARADTQAGELAEAESRSRKALTAGRHLVGDQSGQLLETKLVLAQALDLQGKPAEAESWARDCLSVAQKEYGSNTLKAATSMSYLAYFLERQGKLADAETVIRQSVTILRKNLPPDHPMLEEALWSLGRELQQEGKNQQAADVERELLGIRRKLYRDGDDRLMETAHTLVKILVPDLDEAKLAHLAGEIPEAWAVLSEDLASHGRWQDARTAAARFLEMQPGNSSAYHLMAPLLAQTADRTAYEDLCTRITTQFAGTSDPRVADRMAKDCLILPRPSADVKVPGELAETAVTLGGKDAGALPFFQCCKGLAEYRQGHFDGAVKWARLASANPFPYSQAEALAILSMGQYKLNQIDAARTNLLNCERVVLTQLPGLGAQDLGGDWRDWIIAHALLTEAQNLIGAPPAGLNSSHPINK
jgi:serine/threonine protein kinase/tetratricopeptide (TPR) repeat protein